MSSFGIRWDLNSDKCFNVDQLATVLSLDSHDVQIEKAILQAIYKLHLIGLKCFKETTIKKNSYGCIRNKLCICQITLESYEDINREILVSRDQVLRYLDKFKSEVTSILTRFEEENLDDQKLDKRKRNSYLILISYLLEKLKINIDDSSAKNRIITDMETTELKIVNKTLGNIFKEVEDIRKNGNKSISEKNKK